MIRVYDSRRSESRIELPLGGSMCDTKNEGWCVKEKADNVCVCEWVREAKSEREGERF